MNKSTFKKIIALLMVLFTCLSLCSCEKLDDMRAIHAKWDEKGILFNGHLYQPIQSDGNYLNYNYANHFFIRVTDPDVPVLLSSTLHAPHYVNRNQTILTDMEKWYVREDLVEAYNESIQNGIRYTQLGFDYYDTTTGESIDYLLSEAEHQRITRCFYTPGDTAIVPEEELFLFEESDNGLFRRGQRYSLARIGTACYVIEYDEEQNQIGTYSANTEAAALINTLFQKATESYSYNYKNE